MFNEEINSENNENKEQASESTETSKYVFNEKALIEEEQKEEEKEFNFTSELYEWVEAVAYSLVTVVFIFTFLLRMVWVEGTSMEDTLHDSDRVIISNFLYEPKQKDIVVVTVDNTDFYNKPLIKRIIATEGQQISFNEKTRKIVVDGTELDEAYIKEPMLYKGELLSSTPVTVPEGEVFVMGDNRNNSLDSRYTQIGTIDKHHILGRVVFRVFPFNKIGQVSNNG